MEQLTDDQLDELYQWVDTIPLSRRKRNLVRDFSDGVLMAEVISHFYPKMVDLFNYSQALRVDSKIYNWKTLNTKVLKKLSMGLDTETIINLANSKPGVIEKVIWKFKSITESDSQQDNNYFDDDFDYQNSAPIQTIKLQQADDRKLLVEKIKECEEHEEYIKVLENKIQKLEQLMRLKDEKIAKLTEKLKR